MQWKTPKQYIQNVCEIIKFAFGPSPWKLSGMPRLPGKKSSHSPKVWLTSGCWFTSCNAPMLNFPRPTVASPGVETEVRIALPVLDDAVVGADLSTARGTVAHCRGLLELAVAALPEALCGVFGWRQDGTASSQLGSMQGSFTTACCIVPRILPR